MRYQKAKCDECGMSFTTEPLRVGRSIFSTGHGRFCTDWGQNPDAGCWPKVRDKHKEHIRQNIGKPENVDEYWKAHSAGKSVALAWDLLSAHQREVVVAEHTCRKKIFRDRLPFIFKIGETIHPFGLEDASFGVMCRMRCFVGPRVQDMYYISWQSPENSGKDSQYEELLLVHRRPDYGQSHTSEEMTLVTLKERTKVPNGRLGTVAQIVEWKLQHALEHGDVLEAMHEELPEAIVENHVTDEDGITSSHPMRVRLDA